jgi:hypothetical protein
MSIPTDAFEPGKLDIDHFVDRDDKKAELLAQLKAALGNPDMFSRSYLITGVRGVGKSIFTRHVLNQLKMSFSGDVAFVVVEGASQPNGFRGILYDLLDGLIDELRQLDATTSRQSRTPERIYNELRFLRSLLGYSEVTVKRVKESLTQYNLKIEASAPKGLVPFLTSRWGLEKKAIDQDVLEMTQVFDIPLMCEAVCQVFDSLVGHRQKVVVFIDDLDQVYGLRESNIDDAEIMFKHLKRVRSCFLIVNLRDYYLSANTTREYHSIFNLSGLESDALNEIVDKRLVGIANRKEIASLIGPLRDALIKKTDNPLAFLTWCHWLINRTDCALGQLDTDLVNFIKEIYTFMEKDIHRVAELFKTNDDPIVSRKALLSHFGADGEDIIMKLEQREIVLPLDYLVRTDFRLNPVFHFLL